MAAPRKIFRIEEMAVARPTRPAAKKPIPRHRDIAPEPVAPGAILAAVALSRAAPDFAALTGRIAGELDAVIRDSEQATDAILTAAESIDHAIANLGASLKGNFEHGLAGDVREAVAQIFEACNFQDLTRQRVAKVTTLLGRIERQLTGGVDEPPRPQSAPLLHGPRLPHDRGHVNQSEIDAILAGTEPAA